MNFACTTTANGGLLFCSANDGGDDNDNDNDNDTMMRRRIRDPRDKGEEPRTRPRPRECDRSLVDIQYGALE